MEGARRLLMEGPKVINVGVFKFYEELKAQGVEATHVDFRPPSASSDLLAKIRKLRGKS